MWQLRWNTEHSSRATSCTLAEQSKARVCCHLFAGFGGPDSAGGVFCDCCVLSGRGLYDQSVLCPKDSYWLWRVIVYDLVVSRMRQPWTVLGCCARGENKLYLRLCCIGYRQTHLSLMDFCFSCRILEPNHHEKWIINLTYLLHGAESFLRS